jgi:hypothetical protein
MNTAVVCTTIYNLEFLPSLLGNLEKYGHAAETEVIIIPDRKSPVGTWETAKEYTRNGFNITYPTLEDQDLYLKNFPMLENLIPYDSDNRRNIGFLMALESGAELIISMDDDNFPDISYDFVGCHSICGKTLSVEHIRSSNSWFNICELLTCEPAFTVYPRGFPYRVRRSTTPITTFEVQSSYIGMNVGLWTSDPDVDAISRNYAPIHVTEWTGRSVALGPGMWSPINTQNTALSRDLLPAYYYILMGEAIEGLVIDRFGDILSGYFTKKVCDHMGYSVLVGSPICEHRRSTHNLFKDLYQELAGIILLEEFTLWLETVQPQGNNVSEAYRCLAELILENIESFSGYLWNSDSRNYFRKIALAMGRWSDAIDQISIG